MRDRPEGVEEAALVSALADGWGVEARSATYLPVGAGSYHWAVADGGGRQRFVTVDDLGFEDGSREAAFGALGRAYDTALALRRDAGLGFVVAPIPARTGSTVWRLDSRYAVSVFPMVDGEAGQFGAHRPQDLAEVVELLAELHQATPAVAAGAPRADLALPGRDRLQDALRDLDGEWAGGPFSEPARRLLAARADYVERSLGDFDRLVEQVRGTAADWVVTHGEPHPGNLIRGAAGLRLVDWDTVQVAPPERDLWMVAGDSGGVPAAYTRATGRPVHPAGLALYRLWWDLADIAIFVDELRRPHGTGEDITASWTYLKGYLE
ncbi:aminoglycoside phosphotransferase family protein [Sphaerisporangium sp. NBC_01403]|uniref:phosphotransferase enzyme family protein n=1 Tax=Sphaerisporangium sp. NBC_01403 TaxID=2903599 RepID=UPI0032543EEC